MRPQWRRGLTPRRFARAHCVARAGRANLGRSRLRETVMRRLEFLLETTLFSSRWILAPFYVGLVVSLLLLAFHFFEALFHFVSRIRGAEEADVILGVLSLVDMVLVGNLILIVIFSGYENFVSRFEIQTDDRPDWMTKVDFGGLKQKLMSSIVAISAIQVLKAFMNVGNYDSAKLAWLVGIHALFLLSMLIVAVSDRIGERTEHPSESRKGEKAAVRRAGRSA
jgi:uncharacterized protein (TIGR00645 family)